MDQRVIELGQRSGPLAIIELPGPPRGKGRPRFSGAGAFVRVYTDGKTSRYEGLLRAAGIKAMKGQPPFEGPLGVALAAVMPVPVSWSRKKKETTFWCTTKPDGDNIVKMCDALNKVVWVDDAQVVRWDVRKFYGPVPRLAIAIFRIEDFD